MENLCADVILGLDFQAQHESVPFKYGGSKPPIEIYSLTTMTMSPPMLFANLRDDCKPIATKSKRYSNEDKSFIGAEVRRLLALGQVVVTRAGNHKKRLAIDYSQTINKFTQLDASITSN